MSEPLKPGVRVTLRVERDGSPSPETIRAGSRPFGGTAFTPGLVPLGRWSGIHREMSDDMGEPKLSTASVLVNDDEGELRAAITENETRFIAETEATVEVLSETGRQADLAWRPLLRGRIHEKPELEIERNGLQRKRRVRLSFADVLSQILDQTIPDKLFLRSDFRDIHRDLENTPIPLIGGEHSDAGAQDVNGNSAEKGLIPLIHVGTILTIDDVPTGGSPVSAVPAYLSAPEDLQEEAFSPP